MKYALLGRGTMNYTCTDVNNGFPRTNGAVAILYDASCLASYHSSLMHEMVGGFLQFEQGIPLLAAAVTGRLADEKLVVGHHTFADQAQVVFDFRMNGNTDYFVGGGPDRVDAPDFAYKGVNNEGGGAVQWAKWTAQGGSGIKVCRLRCFDGRERVGMETNPSVSVGSIPYDYGRRHAINRLQGQDRRHHCGLRSRVLHV